jgi:hypothetical protein
MKYAADGDCQSYPIRGQSRVLLAVDHALTGRCLEHAWRSQGYPKMPATLKGHSSGHGWDQLVTSPSFHLVTFLRTISGRLVVTSLTPPDDEILMWSSYHVKCIRRVFVGVCVVTSSQMVEAANITTPYLGSHPQERTTREVH